MEQLRTVDLNEVVCKNQDISINSRIENESQSLTKHQKAYLPFKRFFDIVLSILALIILSPLFLIVSIIIKLDSKGPVFYLKPCVGKDGRIFYQYKFRSMKINADNLEEMLSPDELKSFLEKFKLKNDPRVTRVGNFLRRTSIDEIPQFFNTLKGDISIVGPRPVIEREWYNYGHLKYRLISVKPGLTGYWQVYGGDDLDYKERLDMQIHYVDFFSLAMDIKILFKTFGVILSKAKKY